MTESQPPHPARPIAVAVVNRNTASLLRRCLQSVVREKPSVAIVVDNASSDESVEMVRRDFPGVALYAESENLGYGAAANLAFANVTAPYVLLLNSDTVLQDGALRAFCRYLDRHPSAALIGPRLIDEHGRLQRSSFRFPTPFPLFLQESGLNRILDAASRHVPARSDDRPRAVPWVLGAVLAMRRDAFEAVDGFDESYFLYYEEVDLCHRLWATGWQVHYAPVTTVVHVGGASTRQRRAEMAVQYVASTIRFYERNFPAWKLGELRALLIGVLLARIARDSAFLRRSRDSAERDRRRENIDVWRECVQLLRNARRRATS